MNKIILIGRMTRDPEIRHTSGEKSTTVAHFTLAVDRRFRRDNEDKTADFFGCVAFGKIAEVLEKYGRKGLKLVVVGRLQNDNYVDRNGQQQYSVKVVVDEMEFAESKGAAEKSAPEQADVPTNAGGDGFQELPDGIDEELPFN